MYICLDDHQYNHVEVHFCYLILLLPLKAIHVGSSSGPYSKSDTLATFGMWDHNAGNYCRPESKVKDYMALKRSDSWGLDNYQYPGPMIKIALYYQIPQCTSTYILVISVLQPPRNKKSGLVYKDQIRKTKTAL